MSQRPAIQPMRFLLLIVFAFLLSGCASLLPSPTATQTLSDTPTPTYTPTLTQTPTLTLTPTQTSTPTPTEIVPPAEVVEQVIAGVKVQPEFDTAKKEWVWKVNGKIERIFDETSKRIMAYSETSDGLIVVETDPKNILFIDISSFSQEDSSRTVTEYCKRIGIDPTQIKGIRLVFGFSKYFDPGQLQPGRDYFEYVYQIYQESEDNIYVRPRVDKSGYLVIASYNADSHNFQNEYKYWLAKSDKKTADELTGFLEICKALAMSLLDQGKESDLISQGYQGEFEAKLEECLSFASPRASSIIVPIYIKTIK
jgi:hypothetical protein